MKPDFRKSIVNNLRGILIFFGRYIVISAVLTLISFLVLFFLFVDSNNSDLGKTTDATIPIVFGPIIGMTLGLLVMYIYDRVSEGKAI